MVNAACPTPVKLSYSCLQTSVKLSYSCLQTSVKLSYSCLQTSLKLSYSCLPSMASKISAHNKKLLYPTDDIDKPALMRAIAATKQNAHYQVGAARSQLFIALPLKALLRMPKRTSLRMLKRTLLRKRVIANAQENEFNARYYNHVHSFKHQLRRKPLSYPSLCGACKDSGPRHHIVRKSPSCCCGSRTCLLCLEEKYVICWEMVAGLAAE